MDKHVLGIYVLGWSVEEPFLYSKLMLFNVKVFTDN